MTSRDEYRRSYELATAASAGELEVGPLTLAQAAVVAGRRAEAGRIAGGGLSTFTAAQFELIRPDGARLGTATWEWDAQGGFRFSGYTLRWFGDQLCSDFDRQSLIRRLGGVDSFRLVEIPAYESQTPEWWAECAGTSAAYCG